MKNYILERTRHTPPGQAAVMPTIGMPDECSYIALVPEASGMISGSKLGILLERLDAAGFRNAIVAPPSAFGVCVIHVDHPDAGIDDSDTAGVRWLIASIVNEVGL